jgi:hypothetical protein
MRHDHRARRGRLQLRLRRRGGFLELDVAGGGAAWALTLVLTTSTITRNVTLLHAYGFEYERPFIDHMILSQTTYTFVLYVQDVP